MKKIIFACFMLLGTLNMNAQKINELPLNGANIESVLDGTWTLTNAQPNDKDVSIKGFTMKGTGFGEIAKAQADGTNKSVICKIFGFNNNSIVFSDADGSRIVYKVVVLSKSLIRLTDGAKTLEYSKK